MIDLESFPDVSESGRRLASSMNAMLAQYAAIIQAANKITQTGVGGEDATQALYRRRPRLQTRSDLVREMVASS